MFPGLSAFNTESTQRNEAFTSNQDNRQAAADTGLVFRADVGGSRNKNAQVTLSPTINYLDPGALEFANRALDDTTALFAGLLDSTNQIISGGFSTVEAGLESARPESARSNEQIVNAFLVLGALGLAFFAIKEFG